MLIRNFIILKDSQVFVLAGNDAVEDELPSNRGNNHIIYFVIADVEVLIDNLAVNAFIAIEYVVACRPQESALDV